MPSSRSALWITGFRSEVGKMLCHSHLNNECHGCSESGPQNQGVRSKNLQTLAMPIGAYRVASPHPKKNWCSAKVQSWSLLLRWDSLVGFSGTFWKGGHFHSDRSVKYSSPKLNSLKHVETFSLQDGSTISLGEVKNPHQLLIWSNLTSTLRGSGFDVPLLLSTSSNLQGFMVLYGISWIHLDPAV